MTESQPSGGSEQSQSPAEIEDHIAQTRDELAETVQALGAKLDVRTRVKDGAAAAVARGRDAVTDDEGRPDRTIVTEAAVAAVAAFVVVGVVVWRRRR